MPFDIHDGRTTGIYEEVIRCEDIEDVHQLLRDNASLMTDWQAFICHLLESLGYSYRGFAARCAMSSNTIAAWCKRGLLPRSREQFLRVAFAAGMTVEETNSFLRRYGKYPQLYPKNIEDSIWIFALRHGMDWEQADELRRHFEDSMPKVEEISRGSGFMDTQIVESRLLKAQTVAELEQFMVENADAFADTYHKLLDFIDAHVAAASLEDGRPRTLNAFLSERLKSKAVASTFSSMISRLRRHGAVPSRTKLIAFGILLEMPPDQINTMLDMAGMEGLCARDRLESVIIFAAESAVVMNPGIELSNAMLLRNFTENPEVRRGCDQLLARWEMDSYAEGDAEIYEYVARSLDTMDDDSVEELKRLLELDDAGGDDDE